MDKVNCINNENGNAVLVGVLETIAGQENELMDRLTHSLAPALA